MTLPVLAQPRDRAAARPRTGRVLGAAAVVMTCLSVAVFAALSASGDPAILAPIGPAGPFADLHHQVAPALMKAACWLAAAAGGAGLVTGLAAVRRGWRPRPGLLLAACSVDVQNYAEYGRIVVLGHDCGRRRLSDVTAGTQSSCRNACCQSTSYNSYPIGKMGNWLSATGL